MPTRTISESAAPERAAPCLTGEVALPADPLIGRVLGERYRLLARIGEGGMGTVYRAEHVVLRRRMAVKVLRQHLCDDEDLVRRFQGEAIAASQIGQENIVEVLDFGRTAEGAFYFVMEELEGESLAALLAASGSLPIERAALVLAQVCRALAAAHAHGIVHRDLKPDNVIVVRREDGTDFVKVVDFGISKHGGESARPRVTRAGMIIGTPEYMAPEQGAAATVDHRADIYAFGVLAYELVTGTLPFHGETAIATLLAHQTKPVEPPRRRRPGLPPALEALILRALEKRPDARQQSMAEVAAELTRVLVAFGLPPVYERAPAPPPSYGPLAGLTVRFARGASGLSARRERPERGTTVAIDDVASAIAVEREPAVEPGGARRAPRVALAIALAVVGVVVAGWVVRLRGDEATAAPATAIASVRAERSPAQPGGVEAPLTPTATPTSPPPSTAASTDSERSEADSKGAVPITVPIAAAPSRAPRPTSDAPRPRHGAAPRVSRGPLGGAPASRENPYRKLDDLKPDPF
ncbi:MAG: serine/threonine-protein kinase [Anaeromyxobacteraceae bacterium]